MFNNKKPRKEERMRVSWSVTPTKKSPAAKIKTMGGSHRQNSKAGETKKPIKSRGGGTRSFSKRES